MLPNPYLKKLGLSDTDRVVIFHADDIVISQTYFDIYRMTKDKRMIQPTIDAVNRIGVDESAEVGAPRHLAHQFVSHTDPARGIGPGITHGLLNGKGNLLGSRLVAFFDAQRSVAGLGGATHAKDHHKSSNKPR